MSVHTIFPVTESSEIGLRKGLFDDLDHKAREIEKKWKSTWLELADICATMKDNQLWREGGYESFGQWLLNACPTSRSMAYLAMQIREELKEISTEELKQIPLGNAEILSRTVKQDRESVLKAAKEKPPREFLGTVIVESPNSHLEQKMCHKFRMTSSASKTLMAGLDCWRLLNNDPDAPAEAALEGLVADYLNSVKQEFEAKRWR